jgi:hypothetical protein
LEVLCRHARLPIVPVAIDGLWRARSMGGYFRHLPHSTVRLWSGEPVAWERFQADPGAVMAELRAAIETRLAQWRSAAHTPEGGDTAILAETARPADSADGNHS